MKSLQTYFKQVSNFKIFSLTILLVLLYVESCEKEPQEEPVLSLLKTMEGFDVTSNAFKTGGVILDAGNSEIISKGICWDTLPAPTIESNMIESGMGDENFIATINNLKSNTKYYVKAFATNTRGTNYGNQIEVSTSGNLIFDGDLNIESQEELDLIFSKNISKINGNLTIMHAVNTESNVGSLEALQTLKGVSGDFVIGNAGLLKSLKGLEALEKVGGDVILLSNDEMTDLKGLSRLKTIGKNLVIRSNTGLLSLEGLSNLRVIGNNFQVQKNNRLESLKGLTSKMDIGGSIVINANPKIKNLEGLEGLKTISKDLRLSNNNQLTSLKGLDNLIAIKGTLEIDNNNHLTIFNGLHSLKNIEGNLSIGFNNQLNNLKGLDNISLIEGLLRIVGNKKLKSLEGLNQLESIKKGIHIANNKSLYDFTALKKPLSGELVLYRVYANLFNPSLGQAKNGKLKP